MFSVFHSGAAPAETRPGPFAGFFLPPALDFHLFIVFEPAYK